MYQNNLNALIDAAKKPNGVTPHERFASANQRKNSFYAIQAIPSLAKNAMCFTHPLDELPVVCIDGALIKLPFKTCWFEFPQPNAELKAGFLCWESTGCFDFSVFVFFESKWIFGGTFNTYLDGDAVATKGFMGHPDESVRGLILSFYGFLMALNCCNIKRTEHKPEASKQSVRRALGRQPLFSTWTLGIDLQRTAREMPGQGGTHASPRLHLRRGHARQHKPGLWCWVQPHVVGDKSLGMVHKDYATH